MDSITDALIIVKDLFLYSKDLDKKPILNNVSLSIPFKKIMTIIGPNGAGKTSLLKVILGLTPYSSGTLWKKPDLKIGYMPQRITLNPLLPLTVYDLLKLSVTNKSSKIDEVMEEVGAHYLKDQRLTTLSGGELQRVLLARALLTEPDLLVLDEPAQGIDVLGQDELYKMIGDIRDKRGCSILLVSHDLHLVMAASDKVLCLNKHVCCSGHPDTVMNHPDYKTLFTFTKQEVFLENLAHYTHHHDHRHDELLHQKHDKDCC